MDDLAFLRERIESYADYTNDEDRRLVDEQVRAYMGEALARILERLHPGGTDGEELSRLLLRCQFADQSVIRGLDTESQTAAEITALHGADRAIVEIADRADGLDAPALPTYLTDVEATLDHRSAIIKACILDEPAPPSK